MKKNWNITILLMSFIFSFSVISTAIAQDPVGNAVNAQIEHDYYYGTNEDFINNEPLIMNHRWLTNLVNRPDGGPAVLNPKIKWQTFLNFVAFNPDDPEFFTAEPSLGLYTWDFTGLQVEEPAMVPLSGHEEDNSLIMAPRFNVSRFVEPKILADSITQQTITITFRLEEELPEEMNSFWIDIGSPIIAYENYSLVESSFVSHIPVEGWNSSNNQSGCQWGIDPSNIEIGKTYTFEATMESTKSLELLGAPIFSPSVWVFYGRWLPQDPSVVTSNSVTVFDQDGIISVTFMADNVVDWNLAFAEPLFIFRLLPVVSQITPPPPPFHVLIPADVTIKPETLNTNSDGQFTTFVQLPQQYDITEIDISTVTCEGASAIKGTIDQGVLILKFHRQDLNAIESGEGVEFTVTGELEDGSIFEGTDTIRVE